MGEEGFVEKAKKRPTCEFSDEIVMKLAMSFNILQQSHILL